MDIKNTSDLVSFVSERAGITKVKAQDALKAMIHGIAHAVSDNSDGRLNVKDLGVFRKVHRKARKGVNPKTGESINISARNTVGFKPSRHMRDSVN